MCMYLWTILCCSDTEFSSQWFNTIGVTIILVQLSDSLFTHSAKIWNYMQYYYMLKFVKSEAVGYRTSPKYRSLSCWVSFNCIARRVRIWLWLRKFLTSTTWVRIVGCPSSTRRLWARCMYVWPSRRVFRCCTSSLQSISCSTTLSKSSCSSTFTR